MSAGRPRIAIENVPLLIGVACGFCVGVFIINVAPQAISGLIDSYGFSEARAGLVNTVEIAVGAASCTFLSPFLLGRVRHDQLVMLGCIAIGCASAGLFFVDQFSWIILLRAVGGAGAGLVLAAASSALAAARDPDRMFAEASILITAVMAGMIYLLSSVKANWGYSGFMACFALLALLLCFPMMRLLPPLQPRSGAVAVPMRRVIFGAGGLGGVAIFTFTLVESGVWNFAERAALDIGLDQGQIAVLLSISMGSGLAGAAATIIAGKVFGRELPIVFGSLLLGLFGYFIYHPPAPLMLVVSLALFNLAFFFVIPFLFGGCAESDSEGRMAAVAAGMQAMGGASGPLFAGYFLELYGSALLAEIWLVLAFFAALFGCAMALMLRNRVTSAEASGSIG